MNLRIPVMASALAALAFQLAPGVHADPAPQKLIDPQASGAEKRFVLTSDQVKVTVGDAAAPGLLVTIEPGAEGYPGVKLKPESAAVWDLSAFGHVEAAIANTGAKGISVALRVDNDGDWKASPWNTESVSIKPGTTGTAKVIFGYTYGLKPGYALKPAEVSQVMLFVNKSAAVQSFRIESIVAAGPAGEKPPVNPASIRVKPANGVMLGAGVKLDPAQVAGKNGAQGAVTADGKALQASFAKGGAVTLKSPSGMWDLREANEVRVTVRNTGKTTAKASVRVESKGGPTDAVAVTLAPGAEKEVAVSFVPAVPWEGVKDSTKTNWNGTPNTGTKFTSDAAGPVSIQTGAADGEQSLLVTSVKAAVAVAEIPGWLGKRPPVEGDWVKTFDEEFDGREIDAKKWNIYAENYWDRSSHFSKDNVLLGGGLVKLRYEKKRGFHNDDPKKMLALTNPKVSESNYATGFLDTYGKWVQRYGYFEARMKLPSAPGLWPAFWLMPDRGVEAGPQWKRASTENGGMEFDIMEYLSRWGVYRFNVALHWDGYQKNHQQTGSTCIYYQPDKDGYVTSGLLWLPGQLVIYANGREVARWESPRISTVPSHLMFTHVMGGWDNNAIDDARLPDDYVIDYVRCWQRKDLASDVDGFKTAPATPAAPAEK